MARPADTRHGRFSWKLIGGLEGGMRGAFLSGQPVDDAAVTLFERSGRKGMISLSLAPGCTEEEAKKLRDMLDEYVSAVGVTEFDEGPQLPEG